MIGIDSNVLVRHLVRDEPVQTAIVDRFLETELSERQPGYISLVVLAETLWVLKRIYGLAPHDLAETVRDLLDIGHLQVEQRSAVARALTRMSQRPGDWVDALIMEIAEAAGCKRTVTCDRGAAKLGMTLLK